MICRDLRQEEESEKRFSRVKRLRAVVQHAGCSDRKGRAADLIAARIPPDPYLIL